MKHRKGKDPEFECLECGRQFFTVAAARRAITDGCPECGGVDVDLWVPEKAS